GLHIRGTANTAGNIAIRNNNMYHQSLESGVLGDWLRVWDDANLVKTTSATDITTGRVPVSGWLGNGRALAYKSQATDDLNDFNVAGAHGLWGGNSLNRPTNNVYVVHVLGGSPSSSEGQIPSRIVQVAYQVGGTESYRRSYNGSSWGAWQKEWNTGNTAAGVPAMLGAAGNAAIRSAIDVAQNGIVKVNNDDSTSRTSIYDADRGAMLRYIPVLNTDITVQANSTYPHDVGASFVFTRATPGTLTFIPAAGVTVNPPYGGTLTIERGMYVTLVKVGTNEYDLVGQTVPA